MKMMAFLEYRKRRFTSTQGEPFTIRFSRRPRDARTVFVIAAHKTGSVLLNNIVDDLAAAAGTHTVPVEPQTFEQGIAVKDWPPELYEALNSHGYIFTGFRGLGRLPEIPIFAEATKIFLVRDPRDVLVSYYFSMAKSHVVPKKGATRDTLVNMRNLAQGTDIDRFVSDDRAKSILNTMLRFIDVIETTPGCTVFKYEDVIFKKDAWVRELAKLMGLSVADSVMDEIAKKHDILPKEEKPGSHIRQVTPGNYRKHLSPESIDRVQGEYSRIFEYFSYPPDTRA